MRFSFLGGANEVGASCTLVEVAGKRILVDAGMRMSNRSGSQLPDLARIQEGGPLDAILLTHAHTDHIGALPLVYLGYPNAPIITAEPSKDLTRVLLADSLRLMESRFEKEEEIPLYPAHAVEGMLGRMQTVRAGEGIPICDDTMVATYVPSGHILGACSITLETPEGVILFAGDYSVDKQQTIEGMSFPSLRPDVMITESTYGNRMHANRRAEEERLVQEVAATVAGGGKALIPSFALGRSQEVILLLLAAQRRGHIPKFPIYVDGMVRTMCQVYANHPDYLRPDLAKFVRASGSPFFYEGGAVSVTARQRDGILNGGPCAIVASSGMLTGGASLIYAERLIGVTKNAIFLTGYQDEESPGHALLQLAADVAAKGEGQLKLDGVNRRVTCQVRKVGLSAHADAGQMLSVCCRMKPTHVVLVHGDDAARAALGATFPDTMKVHSPENGSTLEFAPFRKHVASLGDVIYLGLAEGDEALDLRKLQTALLRRDGAGRRYTARELAQAWHGKPTLVQTNTVAEAVKLMPDLFRPDRNRPFLFTVNPASGKPAARAVEGGTDQGSVLKRAQALLGNLPGYNIPGVYPGEQTLLLKFDFPERAATAYAELFARLAAETGWAMKLSPKADVKALTTAVREVCPLTWDVSKVSLFPNEVRVKAKIRVSPGTPESELAAAQSRYLELTGRHLEFELMPEPPQAQVLFDENGRMEFNAAQRYIKNTFAERGVAVLRCGKKTDPKPFLELGLISPQVAEKHKDLFEHLSQKTGWELVSRSEPNQQAILIRARQLLPPEWGLSGAKSAFLKDEGYISFNALRAPDRERLQQLSTQLENETGFRLHVGV